MINNTIKKSEIIFSGKRFVLIFFFFIVNSVGLVRSVSMFDISGPDQVYHVEPFVEAEGGEGLAEVREGEETQGQDRTDQR